MADCGYYLDRYNWSVRKHNGQWCMFARQPEDRPARTSEQIQAVEAWARSNRDKYQSLIQQPGETNE